MRRIAISSFLVSPRFLDSLSTASTRASRWRFALWMRRARTRGALEPTATDRRTSPMAWDLQPLGLASRFSRNCLRVHWEPVATASCAGPVSASLTSALKKRFHSVNRGGSNSAASSLTWPILRFLIRQTPLLRARCLAKFAAPRANAMCSWRWNFISEVAWALDNLQRFSGCGTAPRRGLLFLRRRCAARSGVKLSVCYGHTPARKTRKPCSQTQPDALSWQYRVTFWLVNATSVL